MSGWVTAASFLQFDVAQLNASKYCVCFFLFVLVSLLIYNGLKCPTLSRAVHPCMKFVEFIKMLQMIRFRWNMDLSDSNFMSALLDYKTNIQNKWPVRTTDAFNNNVKVSNKDERHPEGFQISSSFATYNHPWSPDEYKDKEEESQKEKHPNRDSLCPRWSKCTNDDLGSISLFLCRFDLSINNTYHAPGALQALSLSTEKQLNAPFY